MPRFKKKGRSRDAFRIYHAITAPTIRPDGYRRLRIPRLGSIRLHDSAKRLSRSLARGAVIKSVTIARGGSRWYAAILVDEPFTQPTPTKQQRAAGRVGIDLGTHHLAALSTGETIDNPRHLLAARTRLIKAHRAYSRTQRGSNRRARAARRLSRIHHQVAERRTAHLHQITKHLATRFAIVAVEDLNVRGMTATARGTLDNPGTRVRQKAGLNRSILDVAPSEVRRQLEYKTRWYGSQIAVCDRWFPSSKTCSACGAVKTKLPLSERVFTCNDCGLILDRDLNAARNIAAAAQLPPSPLTEAETQNARGADPTPTSGGSASMREDHAA